MKVKIKLSEGAVMPKFATKGAAGADLCANVKEQIVLHPSQRLLVPTGVFIAVPEGYEAQIRPRSGLALKHGITVLNTPGTIDDDYRGEVGVILINHGLDHFVIEPGMRIAQMVIKKCERVEYVHVVRLDDTDRGEGGFGSTGYVQLDSTPCLITEPAKRFLDDIDQTIGTL